MTDIVEERKAVSKEALYLSKAMEICIRIAVQSGKLLRSQPLIPSLERKNPSSRAEETYFVIDIICRVSWRGLGVWLTRNSILNTQYLSDTPGIGR